MLVIMSCAIARIRTFLSQKCAPEVPPGCLLTTQLLTSMFYQIISTEESLVKAVRTARSIRNAFAPINKLPPEILTHICTFTPDADVTSDLAHPCAQVCRSWRNILLTSPSLWSEIHMDDPIHLNVHLARSGKVPLEVYFYEGSPVDQFRQKIIPHIDRVQLLMLSLRPGNCDQILDLLESGPKMMLLRDFHFKKGSPQLKLSAPVMEKISSFAANTVTLVLSNVDIHLSSLTFPRLQYFALNTEDGFKGSRISDVIDFLRAHPILKEIELHRASYSSADDASTHIEPVAFQNLESIAFGGRPSAPSPDSRTYLEVELLPYLHLPPTCRRGIWIDLGKGTLPRDTNYLLTLIRAHESVSSPGGGFGEGTGFTCVEINIEESPSTLIGRLVSEIARRDNLYVEVHGPEDITVDRQSWSIPDWETVTTDGGPGVGKAGEDGIQAQLSRLDCFLDPLRWSPSPLAAIETLLLAGFGYTRDKEKYLRYLRECFRGLARVRNFQVEETNPRMVTHLLRPFEDESGGIVLVFPLLELLSIEKFMPVELPLPALLEVVKRRAALGNVLEEVLVDDVKVDPSGLLGVQERS